MPWYIHLYHATWLLAVLSLGYFISWWASLAVIAVIVWYGLVYA